MPARNAETAGQRAHRWRAHAALFLMTVIWAVNFSVAKIALRALSPLAFNALRFPLAALALFLLLRLHGPVELPAPQDRLRFIGLGILGNVIYQMGFIFGLDHTRAGTASVLLAGTPLMTALLSAWLGHERVNPRVLIGVVCTLAGIALVVWFDPRDETRAQSSFLGPLLLLGASMSWAVYTVGSRGLVSRYGPLAVTFWTLTVGATVLFLIGIPAVARADAPSLPFELWLAIVYAGVLSIALAYLIWYNGVAVLGNTRTATYSNLVPVLTLGVAWLWLAEVPRPGQVVGAFVIIAGVSLAQWRPVAQRETGISSPG